MGSGQIPILCVLSLVLNQEMDTIVDSYNAIHSLASVGTNVGT